MKFFEHYCLLSFLDEFKDDNTCKNWLAELKWKHGFKCRKCGSDEVHQSKDPFIKRCKSCFAFETSTADTIFHNVKFPLRKAFLIAFLVYKSNGKIKGQCWEYAKVLHINNKTAQYFEKKVAVFLKDKDNRKFFPMLPIYLKPQTKASKIKRIVNQYE